MKALATQPWNAALHESWFVVAQSKQIEKKPLAVKLLGRPIVLARLGAGLSAFEDCCPHRCVPLARGTITDAGLQCAYHGWVFDRTGRCISIPGMACSSQLPAVRANTVQTFEHQGLVWARLTREPEDAVVLPNFLSRLHEQHRRFIWTDVWNARAVDALENFLDPLHTAFIHAGMVRRGNVRRPVQVCVTRSAGETRIEYRGAPTQSGLLYRLFESPRQQELAHFSVAAAGTAQLEYRYQNGSALYFTLHFTPETELQTRVHGTFHVEGRWAPDWAVRLFAWPFLRRVAKQDQNIVEAQARNHALFGYTGVSTELDVVRRSLDEIWGGKSPAISQQSLDIQMLL